MPRKSGGRKEKSSRNRNSVAGYLNQADVKLGDFADNPAAKLPSRVSKKTYHIKYDKAQLAEIREEANSNLKSKLNMTKDNDSTTVTEKMKKEEEEDLAWDERDWDEKDLTELEIHGDFASHHSLEEDEEVEENIVKRSVKKSSKKKRKKTTVPSDEGTREYPSDLWFILADYIRPEDIATFSCLCKTAYGITRTASFWRKLFYRYFNSSSCTNLPSCLNLEIHVIRRSKGLRAVVIRALYFLHEPYKLAVNKPLPVGEGQCSPEAITDFTCLYTWSHGKLGHHFTHFMKLRQLNKDGAVPCIGAGYDPAVFANENHGECILRIHCEHFQDVPSARIMGLQLIRSSVSVSANMRHHRVKLEFGRKDRRGSCIKSSVVAVFLDPVLRVDVLHWWHPQFRESSQRSIDKAVADNVANLRENIVWEGL